MILGAFSQEMKPVAVMIFLMILFALFLVVLGSRRWVQWKELSLKKQEKLLERKKSLVPDFFQPVEDDESEDSKRCDFSTK